MDGRISHFQTARSLSSSSTQGEDNTLLRLTALLRRLVKIPGTRHAEVREADPHDSSVHLLAPDLVQERVARAPTSGLMARLAPSTVPAKKRAVSGRVSPAARVEVSAVLAPTGRTGSGQATGDSSSEKKPFTMFPQPLEQTARQVKGRPEGLSVDLDRPTSLSAEVARAFDELRFSAISMEDVAAVEDLLDSLIEHPDDAEVLIDTLAGISLQATSVAAIVKDYARLRRVAEGRSKL